MNYKQRLNEYIEQDQIYQDYKKGKEPAHNDGESDFEWFCIEHCKDIENLLEEAEELHNKIDKAIEFINNNGEKQYNHHDNYRGKWYSPDELDTILEILKGENND